MDYLLENIQIVSQKSLNCHNINNVHYVDIKYILFSQQASADGFPLDVKTIMDPWLNQMGFPLVSVIRSAGGTATVSQTLFQNPPNQEMNVESPWKLVFFRCIIVQHANNS